jgi:hypothetical protein
MTAPVEPLPTSRESFFAIYWDHAHATARFNACLLAGIPHDEINNTQLLSWDELLSFERPALRHAILKLIQLHDLNRKELARIRELNGSVPMSPKPVDGAKPDGKGNVQASG